ncbi:major strawberry allergen Fra a 1.06-like [Gossypium arboreum]|uniref:major strawberry allergen Fra a 1.06-like n=1 Tax=Gossypium arboreum TaxID=29729 RepID=UPI0008191AC8|nr:major strawberry allergen Fra a 1.06-like [Gossypium arboreum]
MGVFTYKSVVITAILPAKMFKACIINGDTLIPKIVPQAFKSVEYIEGNGEASSIKKVTFGKGSQFKYMKQKVEAIDNENFVYIYNVVEGDALMNKLEKITYETKLKAFPDGGSVCRTTSKYYTIGDLELKEEGIKAGKDKALGIFKAIEAYILENPNAY